MTALASTIAPPARESTLDLILAGHDSFQATEVFGKPGQLDAIIDTVTAEVRAIAVDISTPEGRKECRQLAAKVSSSKTFLAKIGKAWAQGHYDIWKANASERTRMEKAFDALRDEVTAPLDEIEQAEKARVHAHEFALEDLKAQATLPPDPSVADIEARITKANELAGRSWEEYSERAKDAHVEVSRLLWDQQVAAQTRERDRAELARLKQQEAERMERERIEKAAQEAAEKARKEVEARAARERERLVREAAAANERAALAVENERKRVAEVEAEARALAERRERNKKHRAKVDLEIVHDLLAAVPGLRQALAEQIIKAIAEDQIRHTSITY